MTAEEKLAYCKVCKNRKFEMESGTVCGLTGEKPGFETSCDDYQEDVTAREEEKKKQETLAATPEIKGFLAFFVYWSIPLSSIATVIAILKEWGEISAIGPFAILFEIAYLVFYLYFQVYTIYGFVKRKPDAVFIAKFQLIVVVVVNLLTMLLGAADESSFFANTPRMITSILWCIVFFSFLCKSETVEDLIPKATRKLSGANKFLIIMSIVIPSLLFVATIIDSAQKTYGATIFSSPEAQIKAACQVRQSQLPVEVSEGLYWTKMYVDGKTVVFKYCFDEERSLQYEEEIPEDYIELMGMYQKELLKISFSSVNMADDPLFGLCSKAGFAIRYVYVTATDSELYSNTFSKEEYTALLSSDTPYVTSDGDFSKILDVYNACMPIEYFEDCKLEGCRLVDSGKGIRYDLELTNMDMSSLADLTGQNLKEFMIELLPYNSDIPFALAIHGGKELVYEFSADCSSWWKMTVRISPDEYGRYLEE